MEAGAQIPSQPNWNPDQRTMRLKDPFFAGTATTCVLKSKTEQTKRNWSVTVQCSQYQRKGSFTVDFIVQQASGDFGASRKSGDLYEGNLTIMILSIAWFYILYDIPTSRVLYVNFDWQ